MDILSSKQPAQIIISERSLYRTESFDQEFLPNLEKIEGIRPWKDAGCGNVVAINSLRPRLYGSVDFVDNHRISRIVNQAVRLPA